MRVTNISCSENYNSFKIFEDMIFEIQSNFMEIYILESNVEWKDGSEKTSSDKRNQNALKGKEKYEEMKTVINNDHKDYIWHVDEGWNKTDLT